jgi:hypothetical protein
MTRLRPADSRTVACVLMLCLASLVGLKGRADGQLSALPSVGASRTYNASQEQAYLGSQGGTLTLARVDANSVHITAGGSLPAFDQTLGVDSGGSIAQPSPPDPFINLLNNLTAVLAAAPPGLQPKAQWSLKVQAPSWPSGRRAMSLPKDFATVPVTVTVTSVSGDIVSFHAQGKDEVDIMTVAGNSGTRESMTIDFELKSGQLQSCTQTTELAAGMLASPATLSQSASLTAK